MNKEQIIQKYQIDFNAEPNHLSQKPTLALIELCYNDKNTKALDYAAKRADFKEALKDYFQYCVVEKLQNSFIFQDYDTLLKTLEHFKNFDLLIPKFQACTMMMASDCFKTKVALLDYILNDEKQLSIKKAQEIIIKAINKQYDINLDLLSCIKDVNEVMVNDQNKQGNLLVLAFEHYSKKTGLFKKIKEMNIQWENNHCDVIELYIDYLENNTDLNYHSMIEVSKDLIAYDTNNYLFDYITKSVKENRVPVSQEKLASDFTEIEKIKLEREIGVTQEAKKLKL